MMLVDAQVRELLGGSQIGLLALRGRALPLVSPVAFHVGGASVWMTTARDTTQMSLARLDSTAAFVVERAGRAIVIQGQLEAYDPLTISGPLRAALDGQVALGLVGYALKNAPLLVGYILDLASVPKRWLPQNRVALRLRCHRLTVLTAPSTVAALAQPIPELPESLSNSLALLPTGFLSWFSGAFPLLVPALWAFVGTDVCLWVTDDSQVPATAIPAAFALNQDHPYRPSQMVGVCFRGSMTPFPSAATAIAARYGSDATGKGFGLHLVIQRTLWWRGFHAQSQGVAAPRQDLASGPRPQPG